MKQALCTLFLICTLGLTVAAHARASDFSTPTLQRIKETGKIRIGFGQTAPFAFQAASGEVIGYSIDICRLVTEKLRMQLNMASIEIEFVARTPSNRIQLLKEGNIDIECNASTNTVERRKSVRFAVSHFYGATRYVSLAKNKLNSLSDLKGRSVSVALGTVNVSEINEANRAKRLNISVVPVETLQGAFDMVKDGRVSAFAMDEVLLSTMIAQSGNPEEYSMSEELVTELQPVGFMMRLDDAEFADSVNAALTEIYRSPEMVRIYHRWFEQPIPALGIKLGIPMSDVLKQALADPKPIE